MASLQLDPASGRWRIRFYYAGQEFKRSIKTSHPDQAETIRRRVEETITLLEQGRIIMPEEADPARFILSEGKLEKKPHFEKALTLEQLFRKYDEELTEGAKETNTRRIERIHAKRVLEVLGSRISVTALTASDLQRYVDQRARQQWKCKRIKPQTIKKEVNTLRTIWSWAHRLELVKNTPPIPNLIYPRDCEKAPFQTRDEIERAITRGKLDAAVGKGLWESLFLRTSEVAEVLEFVKDRTEVPWFYPMLVFAAHTGARKSEMMRSQVDDLKFDLGIAIIREKKKRKGRESFRQVEITSFLKEVMRDYLESKHPGGPYTFCRWPNVPLKETRVHEVFRDVFHKSKWQVLRGFHTFRHSFASNLAAAGVDQRVIDEFMGHQTEAMRRRYRHLFPEQRRKAIELVYAREGK